MRSFRSTSLRRLLISFLAQRDPRFTGANGILRAHRVLPLAFTKHADSLLSYNRLVYSQWCGTLPTTILAQAQKLLLNIVLLADSLLPMLLGLGLLARKGEKAARAIRGRRADREECLNEYATSWAECKSEWKALDEQEREASRWMYENCESLAASVDPWSSAFSLSFGSPRSPLTLSLLADPSSKRPSEPRTRLADLPGWIPPSVDFLVGTRAAIALQVEQIYRSLAAYGPEVWATPEMGDLGVLAEQWVEVEELSLAGASFRVLVPRAGS